MTTNTPQKNIASHFENPYTNANTPTKVLDNIEVVSSHVLMERNRKSDIFHLEQLEEPAPTVNPIRSNDVDNDAAAATFRIRQQQSSVFVTDDPAPQPPPVNVNKPYKISNVFG